MRIFFLAFVIFTSACVAKAPILKSFNSPQETFETWRQSVERLDFETLIACYATAAKPQMRKTIEETSEEGLRAMRDEARRTKFRIEKVVYEKDRAYLRAVRQLRHEDDLEVLVMIKEGQEWKLLP
jgi:hypothetical protein